MDDLEFLKSAQLYQTNSGTGISGITLAGILLLGRQLPLLNTIPHHRTDLILRKVNLDRYNDRDFVEVGRLGFLTTEETEDTETEAGRKNVAFRAFRGCCTIEH